MNIEYQGITYFITQKENESKNSLIDRSWFIAKKYEKVMDYEKIIKQSNIYSNIKNLECRYNNSLENTVLDIDN
jgi:hypothetical protein